MPLDEDDVVELVDARSIRAIAHPARLVVIDRLYGDGRPLTATKAAELVGTTASAMSYHLRALERFGIVKRAEDSGDGRERPWIRAAADLRIRPTAPTPSPGIASATGAVVAMALDVAKQRLLASVERSMSTADKQSLDSVTSLLQTTLLVTSEEATDVQARILELVEPFEVERRSDPPDGAARLSLLVFAAPETDVHGNPAT